VKPFSHFNLRHQAAINESCGTTTAHIYYDQLTTQITRRVAVCLQTHCNIRSKTACWPLVS